ncbi:MAG: putative lipid II flippase FtsW [Verrucomicrobiota bacterium]|nr:MAG: putative lipid II flippase FtsW [Verrucomicrobiota bacterium]
MKRPVKLVLALTLALNSVGLVALPSASLSFGSGFFKKQLLAVALSLFICLIFAKIPLQALYRHRKGVLQLAFLGLVLVLIPSVGHRVNGSRRWIPLGGFNLQVSEFVKIALIIWLAGYLAQYQSEVENFTRGFVKPMFVCAALSFFVLCEPDYGTTFLMMSVTLAMFFLSGTRLRHLLSIVVLGALAFGGLILLSPVRLQRVTAFFDVENHRFDTTYQLWQGILCFAAGGMQGAGAGLGLQKFSYLPEAHTDFIFPVIGEEFGGWFAIGVVLLFFLLEVVVLWALHHQEDRFAQLLGGGAVLMIALQAVINIAVVTGCMPTKGIALPFISYGGSNLVAMYGLIGLVINCINYTRRDTVRSITFC